MLFFSSKHTSSILILAGTYVHIYIYTQDYNFSKYVHIWQYYARLTSITLFSNKRLATCFHCSAILRDGISRVITDCHNYMEYEIHVCIVDIPGIENIEWTMLITRRTFSKNVMACRNGSVKNQSNYIGVRMAMFRQDRLYKDYISIPFLCTSFLT